MPVRIATFADLQLIAKVLAAAFYDEELNAYFFPYRETHPEDYLRAWYHVVLKKWWDYNSIWIVSYVFVKISEGSHNKGDGCQQEQITGAAQWSMEGIKPKTSTGLRDYINPGRYMLPVVSWYLRLHHILFRNCSMVKSSPQDPQPLSKWEFGDTIWPFCMQYYQIPVASQGRWELDILGVHPEHQKRGYASKLIDWGLQRAKEQKLPAVVMMAKGLEEFYKRQGFEILVGYATTDDSVTEEQGHDGISVRKSDPNPLRQRGIGGGGIAWTYTHTEQ